MAGCLIKPDAFKRAAHIDAELDWPSGLAIGKLAHLWTETQSKEAAISVAKRRLILQWAQVEREFGDQFIELCCVNEPGKEGKKIHFLEPRPNDHFYIVGNPTQIDKLAGFSARASAGGKAKADKQRAPSTAKGAASSTASSRRQAVLQAADKQCLTSAKNVLLSLSLSPSSAAQTEPFSDRPTVHDERARPGARTRVDPNRVGRSVKKVAAGPPMPTGLTVEGLVAIWNDWLVDPMLPVETCDPDVVPTALAALAEHPDVAYWQARMKQLVNAPFARGEVPTNLNPEGWVVTFTHLVQLHDAIRAGRYDSHKGTLKRQVAPAPPPPCDTCGATGWVTVTDGERHECYACGDCVSGERVMDENTNVERFHPGVVRQGWRRLNREELERERSTAQ